MSASFLRFFLPLTLIAVLACSTVLFSQLRQAPLLLPTSKTVRIGAHLELSGRYASYGLASLNGIRLALQEINATGGLLGKPVELIVRDNYSDEDASRNAFLQLAQEEQVVAVIGGNISSCAIAIAPLAEQLQIPLLVTWASNPRVTQDDTGRTRAYVFRICYIDTFQGTAMARFARNSLQLSHIALSIDSTSPYSQGLSSFFEQAFLQQEGQILAKAFFTPSKTNWQLHLNELLNTQPEALFISGYQSETGKLIILARTLGFSGPILISDAWDDSEMLASVPAPLLNNLYHPTQATPLDPAPAVQEFSTKYTAFSNAAPLQTSTMAYDATLLLADAIRRSNSTDRQKLRSALEHTQRFPGISGQISFNDHHDAKKSIIVIEINHGNAAFYQRISAH